MGGIYRWRGSVDEQFRFVGCCWSEILRTYEAVRPERSPTSLRLGRRLVEL